VKILIVLMGAVGDVTRGLILPHFIKKAFPDCTLGWVVEPMSQSLVSMNQYVDSVFVFQRPKGIRAVPPLIKELRAFKPDIVLDLQRHSKSGLFTWLSGAKRRIGFHPKNAKEGNWFFQTEHIPYRSDSTPKIDHYLLFLEKLGIVTDSTRNYGLKLPTLPNDVESKLENKPIAFILGSAWETKDWPIEGFVELAQRIRAKGQTPIILIGSKGQHAIGEDILKSSKVSLMHNLAGKTSLAELCTVLSKCSVVVGPDSGPGHMAAAVGVPYISLFGPTSPTRTAPDGNLSLVIQSHVPCAPCYRRRCPGLDKICMRLISADMVMDKIERIHLA